MPGCYHGKGNDMTELPTNSRVAVHRASVLLAFLALVAGAAFGVLGERAWVRRVTDSGTWMRDGGHVFVRPSDTVLSSLLGANWRRNEIFFRILTRPDGWLDPTNTLDLYPFPPNLRVIGFTPQGKRPIVGAFWLRKEKTVVFVAFDSSRGTIREISRKTYPSILFECPFEAGLHIGLW